MSRRILRSYNYVSRVEPPPLRDLRKKAVCPLGIFIISSGVYHRVTGFSCTLMQRRLSLHRLIMQPGRKKERKTKKLERTINLSSRRRRHHPLFCNRSRLTGRAKYYRWLLARTPRQAARPPASSFLSSRAAAAALAEGDRKITSA